MHSLTTQKSLFGWLFKVARQCTIFRNISNLLQEDREGVLRGIYENIQARN
jgi:hypothetical protein